jgi:glycosyltransferase involved in cell wall biosynthesis
LYNGSSFIERAIASVFAQTLQPTEIIVVDDGSTDNGIAVVESLPGADKIVILRKENGGQSSARNLGVSRSTSALIAFLDQDDIWYSRHLEQLIEPFMEPDTTPPLGWVYSNLDEIDERGDLVNRRMFDRMPITHPKHRLFNCLSEDMFVLPSASLISREAFDAVGGFDERLSGYEDDDLFLRLFRAGYRNVYIDEPLSQWRIYFNSSSYGRRMAQSRLIYFEKLCTLYPDDLDRNHFYIRDMIAPRFCRSILAEYGRAARTGATEQFRASVRDLKIVSARLRTLPGTAIATALLLSRSPRIGRYVLQLYRIFKRLGARIAIG